MNKHCIVLAEILAVGCAVGQTNKLVVVTINDDGWDIYTTTNTSCTYTPTNWCERIPACEHEQAVKDLASGGVICRVLGHMWRDGRPGEGYIPGTTACITFLDHHPGTTFRTCKTCGKCESKTEGEWR